MQEEYSKPFAFFFQRLFFLENNKMKKNLYIYTVIFLIQDPCKMQVAICIVFCPDLINISELK